MTLAKLAISPRAPSKLKPFLVPFNPASYTITKSVTWEPAVSQLRSAGKSSKTHRKLNAPLLTFGGGGSRILTLKLFFDVTEPINGIMIKDVRLLTDRFVELTRKERLEKKDQPPPICVISWGGAPPGNTDFPFTGVVTRLDQDFTLFESDGRPVRANLTVTFTEFADREKDQRETDPEFTTHVIKRGDTLSSIAAQMYGNPALWRIIADANHLDDPRQLEIGMILNIPKVS